MKNLIKTSLITFLLFLSSSFLFSQETRLELGDRYFDQHAYNKAIPLFEGAKKTRKIYAKLGDCYYYTSQPEKAVENYIKVFESNNKSRLYDQYRLRYALSLLSVRKKQEALIEFKKYYKDYENINQLKLRTIDTMSMDLAENLSINSKYSDFGPFIYSDTLYFASSREKVDIRKHNKELYKWNEHPYLEIYTAAIKRVENSDTFKLIHSDSSNIKFKTPAHESSVAIIDDSTMYFSGGVVNSKNKIVYNKRGVSNLKLQKAKRTKVSNNKWVLDSTAIELLSFLNHDNYSFGNPALSIDNKRLFFVSCAPYPTAQGQSDIYYVDIKEDGSFGQVESVPGINTSGRESFPFISWDGTLYFSSDGFYNYELGLGLLDIYKVDKIDEVINNAKKEIPQEVNICHLESPFNSAKDDFAFYMEKPKDSNTTEGYAYFSSNREHPEAQCDDDIYRAKLRISKCDKLTTIKVLVTDSLTNIPLKDASIELMDSDDNIIQTVQVDSTGTYNFEVESNKNYHLRASKEHYDFNLQEIILDNYYLSKKIIELKLEPYPCEFKVDPIEFESNKYDIRLTEEMKLKPLLDLLLANPDLRILIESHTDSIGSIVNNLKLSQQRAEATEKYLISNGVNASQIIDAVGQGENCPIYTTSYINSLATRAERREAHNKNRRSIFILEDCEDYVSDCKKHDR